MSKKIMLPESEMPRSYYNIAADLPNPVPPPLHPATGQPVGPDDLAPIFPMPLIEQEVSQERYIDIPEAVMDVYRIWRPTPLVRAERLEKLLDAPVKIYFKNESVSPPGSHKPNTAVPQAYYNKISGVKKLTTETGAGQWGSALAFACNYFGLECKVFMVKVSFEQKPYRKLMMQTWGANCIASPSNETEAGRRMLERSPDSPGTLGMAISEAVEAAVTSNGDTRYALGSVLNHVMLHQTVIGQEAIKQFESIGEYPDVVIGCAGGGSNFAGLAFPFLRDKMNGKSVQVIAAEPASCPTMTKGPYAYDLGDTEGMTPLMAMYTLGHNFVPPSIHAGGLRYHGMSPLVSALVKEGLVEPRSYTNLDTFGAGVNFARSEGIIPAPETNHALAAVEEVARQAKAEGKSKTIVVSFSGHGVIDLPSYDAYFSGKLTNYALPEAEIAKALEEIRVIPQAAA